MTSSGDAVGRVGLEERRSSLDKLGAVKLVSIHSRFATIIVVGSAPDACASRWTRIPLRRQNYGLGLSHTEYVGDRLQALLSIGQLQQLGRAPKRFNNSNPGPGRLSGNFLMRAVAQVDDVKVPIEFAKQPRGVVC